MHDGPLRSTLKVFVLNVSLKVWRAGLYWKAAIS